MLPTPNPDKPPAGPRALLAVVLGLTAAVCLMLLAFAAPALNSGPHDLPLAVSGPEAAVQQLRDTLTERDPGAFALTTYTDPEAVAEAIEARAAIGGISFTDAGTIVQTASAAGSPYAGLLKTVGAGLEADGLPVTYIDVVPLPAGDPAGSGISALALPLAFGGMASAAVLVTLFNRSRALRVTGAMVFSALAGIAATAVLHGMGALGGMFWPTAAGVGLGIAAISLTVLGLESLLGFAGLGIGGLAMVFIANPLSGVATGPDWLPRPRGAIGQSLPIGAAGTVIRSAAFFDCAGSGRSVLVLLGWIALGLILVALSARRAARTGNADTTTAHSPAQQSPAHAPGGGESGRSAAVEAAPADDREEPAPQPA
ncbi:MAG TPA: ABC transporter permease [Nocardia sp.]|uniref:ABC transporter permease n=1 Tax=Nocardia sp. TaxID=1821 RepID=UPI002B4B7704|nr:ABC transporter permease [Nocardia sp.]HLS76704.1 ABC transporter permease [Nocardia sp.]